MQDFENRTKEELIERILELELFNSILMSDQKKHMHMDFSWTGNLGKWYFNLKTGTVVFSPLKV